MRFLLRQLSRAAFTTLTKLRIIGRENLPASGPLIVIANHEDVAVGARETLGNQELHPVGVLILIDENMLELVGIPVGDLRVILEQPVGGQQQIIEVRSVLPFEFLLIGGVKTRGQPLRRGARHRLKAALPSSMRSVA